MIKTKFLGITLAASLFANIAVAQTIYITHGDGINLGTVSALTGTGTDIGAFGQSEAWALTMDVDGTLYTTFNGFSGDAQLATVNPATGAIDTTIGGLGTSLIALEIDGSGQMWGVGFDDGILYRINKATASVSPVGDTGVSFTMDLNFDLAGNLYSTVSNNLYMLNPFTGASTLITSYTGIISGEVMSIMSDDSGVLYATAYVDASPLYEVNSTTGVATVIGATGFNRPHGGDITSSSTIQPPTPVPAMSAYGLVVLILSLLFLSRRRLRASSTLR